MAEGAHHDQFLSIRAASQRLGCGRALLREAIGRGELRAYQLGARTMRVRWADVLAFVERHRIKATASAEQIAHDAIERERRKRARRDS